MAEAIAVRNLLYRFGIPADAGGQQTIAWLATQGINTAEAMSVVNDTVLKSLMKQLSTDAVSLPADQRPLQGVMVNSAITVSIFAVRWYCGQRGQTPDINLLNTLNHINARDFFRMAYDECRKYVVDMNKEIDFPSLSSEVTTNSPIYQKFKEEFQLVAQQERSSDGICTLGANIREDDDPVPWADVDMDRSVHDIANDIAPLAGKAFRDDEERIHKYLVLKAFKYAGSSFPAKYILTKEARPAIKAADAYYYPPADIELQHVEVEKDITKVKWYGEDRGLKFEKAVGKLRSGFLKLDNLGRSYTEEKKVLVLLNMLKFKNHEIQTAMLIVKGDKGQGGKAGNFELAQDFLKDAIPSAKDKKTVAIKAVETGGDEYPDDFDDEGRNLSEAERKDQCKPVSKQVWWNSYSQEKRNRIIADRARWNLNKPKKDKNGGGGGKGGGGGNEGNNNKTLKRKQQRAVKKIAKKEAKKAAKAATIAAIKAAKKKSNDSDDDDNSSSSDSDDEQPEDPASSIKGGKKQRKN